MKFFLFAAAVCASCFLPVVGQVRLGHVDAQAILLDLPERATAQATIESQAAQYEAELKRMQEEMQTKFAEYQQKAATWPEAIRTQKERELQGMDTGLQEFAATVQEELQKLEQSLLEPMIERVQTAIDEVGKEQKFTYVCDSSTGATLYNGGEDIAPLVRAKLGM